jgi:signal transduction histidine kinase
MVGQLKHTRLGTSGYFLVASPRDRLIVFAPDVERFPQPLPPTGVSPLLDQLLQGGFEDAVIARDEHGAEILGASRRMVSNGWIVLGGVPSKEAFAPIADFKQRMYITAFVISLLIAAVLRFILTVEFARLQHAGEAMRRMTENEAPFEPIPITQHDEIGALIENFNRLAMERGRLDRLLRGEIAERRQAQHALAGALTRLQALSERITQIHEDERREFAYELHERSTQELSSLMINLKMLRAHCTGAEASAQLAQARAIAQLALRRVRSMSVNLHPPQLETFGLAAALQAYCTRQGSAAGWALHFDAPQNGERAPRRVEVACFRVAQEALANVARHAQATAVWVSLCDCDEGLKLSVRDDGIGFDVSVVHSHSGQHWPESQELRPATGEANEHADIRLSHKKFGLLGMEERVRQVGGRLEIRSSPGHGTEICATFPASPPAPLRAAHTFRTADYLAVSGQLNAS